MHALIPFLGGPISRTRMEPPPRPHTAALHHETLSLVRKKEDFLNNKLLFTICWVANVPHLHSFNQFGMLTFGEIGILKADISLHPNVAR
jgi:hypothetical protein